MKRDPGDGSQHSSWSGLLFSRKYIKHCNTHSHTNTHGHTRMSAHRRQRMMQDENMYFWCVYLQYLLNLQTNVILNCLHHWFSTWELGPSKGSQDISEGSKDDEQVKGALHIKVCLQVYYNICENRWAKSFVAPEKSVWNLIKWRHLSQLSRKLQNE